MLSIGIAGLPNVGKSTLFKALTKKQVDISNYAFTTIDPNVGIVAVPDERLELLAKMSGSEKIVPTAIEFIDIAGLVRGAAKGEGLGNKFLANIREVDVVAHVVRVFESARITHVHNTVDPANDIETINAELIMADLETVERKLQELKGNAPKHAGEKLVYARIKESLDRSALVSGLTFSDKERPVVDNLHLLTNKKVIYVLNASEEQAKNNWRPDDKLLGAMDKNEFVVLSAELELLLSESSEEEQKILAGELGMEEPGLNKLIKTGYKTLGLVTFLTTGPKETRAWTARLGDPIPRAAGVIHTDFEEKFIRADVISWQELLEISAHSNEPKQAWNRAKEAGRMRTVGKDYVVQEGDVVEIKI